jgi:hypothetical protein
VDGAADRGSALGEAGEAVTRAEVAEADDASRRRMVDDLEADAVAPVHLHLDGRARSVPDRVGQAFLQDTVGGPGDMPWYRTDVTGDVEVELDAGLCGARQEVLDVLPGQRMFQRRGQQAGEPADVPGGFACQLGDVAEQFVGGRIIGRKPLPGAGLDADRR